MDIILLNNSLLDNIVLYKNYTLDFDTTDTMDFKLSCDDSHYDDVKNLSYACIPDTEIGGIIDYISHNTQTATIDIYGRNYRGLLNSAIVCPPDGQDYKIVDGKLADIIPGILHDTHLDYLFSLSDLSCNLKISNYQIPRYCSVLYFLKKVELLTNTVLRLNWSNTKRKMIISFDVATDWTQKNLYTQLDMTTYQHKHLVNHLICLGTGELKERQRIDLYASKSGKISKKQTVMDDIEYTQIYDYANAGTVEELETGGIQKLQELRNVTIQELDLKESNFYKIGDVVGGYDNLLKNQSTSTISNIVITVENNKATYNYTLS